MSDYEFWDELGKIFNAVVAYQEKTIEFNKRFINPWIRLGNVFDRQDHNRDAIRAYQKAIEIDPDNAQNWYELGNVYFRSEAFEEAVQAFNKAIELDPNPGWPFSNLALTLVSQGKYAEAVPLYRKSIDLLAEDKDKAMAWNRLGNVYRKLNEYEQAVEAFQKADELDAENAGFRDELDDVPSGISLAENALTDSDKLTGVPSSILQMVEEGSQAVEANTSNKPEASTAVADQAVVEAQPEPAPAVSDKSTTAETKPDSVITVVTTIDVVSDSVPQTTPEQTPKKPSQTVESLPSGSDGNSPMPSVPPEAADVPVPEVPAVQPIEVVNSTSPNAVNQTADGTVAASNEGQPESSKPQGQALPDPDQTVTVVVQNTVETFTEYTTVVNTSSETSDVPATVAETPVEPAAESEVKPVSNPEQKPEAEQVTQAVVDKSANQETTPAQPEVKDDQPVIDIEVKKETEVVIVREVTTIEETIEGPTNQADNTGLATGQVAYEEYLKDSVETVNSLAVQSGAENPERPGPATQPEPATRVDAEGELQIEMDTKNAHVWNELGNVYFNSSAYEDAIVAYSKAIELDRWFAWPYSNLALAYTQKGRFAEAILLYQRSIELFSNDKDKAISWNRLGNVYRRMNDYDNAIAAYQRADEIDPGNSTLSLQSRFSLLGAYATDQKPNYVL